MNQTNYAIEYDVITSKGVLVNGRFGAITDDRGMAESWLKRIIALNSVMNPRIVESDVEE